MGFSSQSGQVIFGTQPARGTPVAFSDTVGIAMKLRSGSLAPNRELLVPDPEIGGGRDTVAEFRNAFVKKGGKIIKEIYPPLGNSDFSPYLADIRSIVGGLSADCLPLSQVLAALRHETGDRLDMAGIEVSPLVQNIIDFASKSTGAVLAWDTFLSGEAAERHKSLVQEIFAGQLTPEDFATEMAKLQ